MAGLVCISALSPSLLSSLPLPTVNVWMRPPQTQSKDIEPWATSIISALFLAIVLPRRNLTKPNQVTKGTRPFIMNIKDNYEDKLISVATCVQNQEQKHAQR